MVTGVGKRSINGIPVLRPAVTQCAHFRWPVASAMLLLICIIHLDLYAPN